MSGIPGIASLEGDRKRDGKVSAMAGKPASREMLVDLTRLGREYVERFPDVDDPNQLVSFGTSGHCGSSLRASFNEAHIVAITQAICDSSKVKGSDSTPQQWCTQLRGKVNGSPPRLGFAANT